MTGYHLLLLAGIGVFGITCQWIAWWAKLPAILFLLLVGILAGPVTGVLDPDRLFGNLLFPVVSLSVSVILFEGALTLRFQDIRGLATVVRNLISVGALVTWLLTSLAARELLAFHWHMSLLFGAIVVVSGPTVVIPMLRTVRPSARIANILRWEGIVIDPLGALLAVLVFDFIASSQQGGAASHVALAFARIVMTGLGVGLAAGLLLGHALRRHWVPEYLRNVTTLTLVFTVFAVSDHLGHESGLLAVTIMGMTMANLKDTHIEDILDFKESLSLLLISGLFIILAARLQLVQFSQLGWGAVGVLAVLMLIARPAAVALCTLGSDLTWRERAMLAWIAPRGIVAAAVSALFALRLGGVVESDTQLLVPLTFLIIVGTVVLQSLTAGPLARWLRVADPEPRGVLIVGANIVGRAIGNTLKEHGFDVLITDSSWDNISAARMDGLKTYFGNAISEHADRHLDLVGIGRMLAVSTRETLNALACQRFKTEFGANAVYELQTSSEKVKAEKHKIATKRRGYKLFGSEATYAKLASLLSRGAEIRATHLGENFDFAAFVEKHRGRAVPMFAIDKKERLHVFVADGSLEPEVGWVVLSLMEPDGEDAEKSDARRRQLRSAAEPRAESQSPES